MAVSGSKDFAITTAEIVEGALLNVGVYDQGEAVDGDDTKTATRRLNLMTKAWVAEGVDVCTRA